MPRADDITALRKSGRNEEALALARRLWRAAPDDVWIPRAYGWALERALRDCVVVRPPRALAALDLLREYAKLRRLERPGLLHSLMLRYAIRLTDSLPGFSFTRFFHWWSFAFVGDIFVPPNLVAKLGSAARNVVVSGRAALQLDRTKNKPGWCAVSLELSAETLTCGASGSAGVPPAAARIKDALPDSG